MGALTITNIVKAKFITNPFDSEKLVVILLKLLIEEAYGELELIIYNYI